MFEFYKRLIIGNFYLMDDDANNKEMDNLLKSYVIKAVSQSRLFYMNEYINIQKSTNGKDILSLPYKNIYIEYGDISNFYPKHPTQKRTSYCVLSRSVKEINFKLYIEKYPSIREKLKKIKPEDLCYEIIKFDDLGQDIVADFLRCFISDNGELIDLDWQDSKSLIEIDKLRLQGIFSFIRLMNIKNIKIQSVDLDKKTVKHIKRNKSNQTHYHILTVTKPTIHKESDKTFNENESSIPLHQVRGHLADYSEGKGLFGKYNIRIWKPDFWRGDLQYGKINKDYKIKTL